ncbi:hypothetical protein OH797_31755 [Streptomyces anulatus]|uniref:hypothetical protein n=1 Tax=Streptomyces TaxID=1883 RepID=UPI0036C524CB
MDTLTRFRCSAYTRIEAEFLEEIDKNHGTATLSMNDQVARSAAVMEQGSKRAMARRLNAHMGRCRVCR